MRIIVFFVHLCFLLLGGKDYSFVQKDQNCESAYTTQNFSQNRVLKYSNDNQSITLIEDADFDLEEEYLKNNDGKSGNNHNNFVGRNTLFYSLNSSCIRKFISNYSDKRSKIFAYIFGNSCPIYIAQRVLRI